MVTGMGALMQVIAANDHLFQSRFLCSAFPSGPFPPAGSRRPPQPRPSHPSNGALTHFPVLLPCSWVSSCSCSISSLRGRLCPKMFGGSVIPLRRAVGQEPSVMRTSPRARHMGPRVPPRDPHRRYIPSVRSPCRHFHAQVLQLGPAQCPQVGSGKNGGPYARSAGSREGAHRGGVPPGPPIPSNRIGPQDPQSGLAPLVRAPPHLDRPLCFCCRRLFSTRPRLPARGGAASLPPLCQVGLRCERPQTRVTCLVLAAVGCATSGRGFQRGEGTHTSPRYGANSTACCSPQDCVGGSIAPPGDPPQGAHTL
ncbi:hypothetical protein NDU88_007636 [Pleurodeles waltl]|uniref:Uncharacterized protein n=1 Tax=Pleurodeles waltl TaxID=8319 RepID=A0AAV7PQJ1_PLEWA|nr:hypothetical protein NDU88_007636 [Pleurodeles waltl]